MADGWLILAPALVMLMLGSCAERNPTGSQPSTQRVTLGDRTFILELALDEDARFKGLSDRPSLPDDGGMLFVFPEPDHLQFVMRDCLMPIDIIFLDAGGRVVSMHAMKLEPYGTPDFKLPRYRSRYPAQFAIELKGGTVATLALNVGDKVQLPLADLKARAR